MTHFIVQQMIFAQPVTSSIRFVPLFARRAVAVLLLLISLAVGKASAQESLLIDSAANLFVSGDSIGVFGNVTNNGHFGSRPGAVIRFSGLLWNNASTATQPDESSYLPGTSVPIRFTGTGGLFWFTQPSGISQAQLLYGGFSIASRTGTSFPNLRVDNASGLFLSGNTDAQIRNQLQFQNGLLWLNGQQLLVGASDPGSITGYDHTKFIVTGATATGGSLYRAGINRASGAIVFPVGAESNAYSPAEITNLGTTARDYRVRKFSGIFEEAVTGAAGGASFVQGTWNIGKMGDSDSLTLVRLQHPASMEGSVYAVNRDSGYITAYDPNRKVWDTIQPSQPLPGTLTTGQVQAGNYINMRSFLNALNGDLYLGKSVNRTVANLGTRIGLSKSATTPALQADGSYNINYTLLIRNASPTELGLVKMSDNLRTTFPSPITVNVTGVQGTGRLVINPGYNGMSDTALLLPSSRMAVGKTDTITIAVNVRHNNVFGTFFNLARAEGLALSGSTVVTVTSSNGLIPDASGGAVPSGTPAVINPLAIKVPAGFSPNNDGINDRFELLNVSAYNVTLEVYDRWGNRVFRNAAAYYNNEWDGTCNQPGAFLNTRLPSGTYYYNITLINKQNGASVSNLVGFLTLLR